MDLNFSVILHNIIFLFDLYTFLQLTGARFEYYRVVCPCKVLTRKWHFQVLCWLNICVKLTSFSIWRKSQGSDEYVGGLTCTTFLSRSNFLTMSLSDLFSAFVAFTVIWLVYTTTHNTSWMTWCISIKYDTHTGKQATVLLWKAWISCLSAFYGSTCLQTLSERPS